MDSSRRKGKEEMPLPPPPPVVPPNVVPQKVCLPMVRRGTASRGQSIQLLTNHFNVAVSRTDGFFFHYSVAIKYEDDTPVDVKGVGRSILDKVYRTYGAELAGKKFAYDGEKSLFTVGSLPQNKFEFTVIMEDASSSRASGTRGSPGGDGDDDQKDKKRMRKQARSKTYKVAINYAAKIPIQSIIDALNGKDSDHFQGAVRVLDIILRQHAAKQGCLLVRQSFFHDQPRNFVDIGGGVYGCRGFHSSFRATQGGLSLNMDVSTTMIVRPVSVIEFLLENQTVKHHSQIDWAKAKKMLKNLRVKTSNTNLEYKICGLSDKKCREQTFSLKLRKERGSPPTEVEITVYNYFLKHRDMKLTYSADLPCINVGKPKRPTYIPVELCSMVSLQRYTKALSNLQRASLVEKSRQKPQERMDALKQALTVSNYGDDPLLQASGIKIRGEFTAIQGRVLQPPKLRVGKGEDFIPRNGRWNFNNKHLVQPMKLDCWVVVNFSSLCDTGKLCRDLSRCAQIKGMSITPPYDVIEEKPQNRRSHPLRRVDEMVGLIKERLPGRPQFILCILAEKKNSDVYGPWKKKILCDMGTFTQCIAPTRVNDQYLTNVLLKINAKLGGINSLLNIEHAETIPLISEIPTLIIGMDVSHGSPGRSDVPSISAVVSSRQWPFITKYRAAVRTQSPKLEMIDSLFQKVNENGKEIDKGIFRELLMDFYISSNKKKPEQIIIFRDGVSESQFNQVLNQELAQIIEACKFLEAGWSPRFMLVVAQKNHHTKLFQANSRDNVPPGTVVDRGICHPKLYDFYMCAHAGMIGTTRPIHYHVLHDELGFSPDDLQELVHSLSYVYQRSTTAISVVAPVCYAHLAAAQMSQFIKLDDFSDRSSTHSGAQGQQGPSIPQLPVLHERVSSSMFFC